MTAALESYADFVGLNFIPSSPRYVEIEVATYLASYVPNHVQVVGLFADAPMDVIERTLQSVRIDLLQLHGNETPDDCAAIAARFDKPMMKALSVTDLTRAEDFAPYCDWLLIDAPALDDQSTGGQGVTFDWNLLKDFAPSKPWMLAGGLTPENVVEAIRLILPDAVDVSSGVEISRGVKDPAKISAFIEAAKNA